MTASETFLSLRRPFALIAEPLSTQRKVEAIRDILQ